MELIKGIVVSLSKYKDNDAIINVLTKDNIVPINIRGAYSKNSKYLKFAHTFYEGEFEIYKGNTKYFKLRNVNILFDSESFYGDYSILVCLELIKEVFTKAFSNDEFTNNYLLLSTTLRHLSSKNEIIKYTLLYIGFFIRISGYSIVTNRFQNNSKDGDVYFSFENGGLVSGKFATNSDIKLDSEEVNILKIIFENKYAIAASKLSFENNKYLSILTILCNFISYYNNINIVSLKMLEKIHS